MIEQICAYIHNYFYGDRYSGTFTIEDNVLEIPGLIKGQYFRICGSRLNDGVYVYPATSEPGEPPILLDETFTGVIWEMRPPRSFLSLVTEIEGWNDKYGEVSNSPYASESFGGYTYSKAQSYANAGGGMMSTWQAVFGSRLNEWRKLA